MFRLEIEGRDFGLKPMNCPGPLPPLLALAAQLPRAAAADRGGGEPAPQRALRRPPRAAPRAPLRPGRRAHLLHARPDPGRAARAASTTRTTSTTSSSLDMRVELSLRPDDKLGTDEEWDFAEEELRKVLATKGLEYVESDGRGLVLRAEDRPAHGRLARAQLAARHRPARPADAEALRARLPGRRQRRAHAGDDPPRAPRLARALRRRLSRAHGRRAAALPRAGAGTGAPGRGRAPRRRRVARRRGSARRASASTWTSARRRSAGASATPSSNKIPYVVVWGDRESLDAVVGQAPARRPGGDSPRTPLPTSSEPLLDSEPASRSFVCFLTSGAARLIGGSTESGKLTSCLRAAFRCSRRRKSHNLVTFQ